ncbi:MAG: ATP-binding cassette domain-containing protein [Candidatus Sedimenticola sp. PURPLELP]
MSPLISIQNLSRNYGDFRAVNDVSFELQAGEILGFLGPNGAGKSTTMRIISGALAPNSGQVMLNGIDLLKHPLDAKAQLGYLPENPPLHHELTVDEYLLFSGRLRAIPKQDMDKALSRVKEQCGLNEVGGRLIGQLSKGFQQRVGIAQAIIHDPRVVILDEPTNGLDPNQILDIRNLIHNLGQERGVILSTHILSEVQAICSRVLILHRGKLAHEQTLNRQQAGELLHLELDTPPQPGELEKLQGVSKVIPLNPHRFKMQLSPGTECSSITEQAVNKGWGVRELSPAGHDLEQVFTRITSLENGA